MLAFVPVPVDAAFVPKPVDASRLRARAAAVAVATGEGLTVLSCMRDPLIQYYYYCNNGEEAAMDAQHLTCPTLAFEMPQQTSTVVGARLSRWHVDERCSSLGGRCAGNLCQWVKRPAGQQLYVVCAATSRDKRDVNATVWDVNTDQQIESIVGRADRVYRWGRA
jgi:hypothetical protein